MTREDQVPDRGTFHYISFIESKQSWCFLIALLARSLEAGRQTLAAPRQSILFNHATSKREDSIRALPFRLAACLPFGGYPTLNKLRLLENADASEYQVLLDHDIVIVDRNRIESLRPRSVLASTNLKDSVEKAFGPTLPAFCKETTGRDWDDVPYYNAGVVIVPSQYRESLQESWAFVASRIVERYAPGHAQAPMPVGNLSFSLSLARANIPNSRLSDDFNQRNWGELSEEPALLHYNNFDPLNLELKSREHLTGNDLRRFMDDTQNRWWIKYRRLIYPLLDERLEEIFSLTSCIVLKH